MAIVVQFSFGAAHEILLLARFSQSDIIPKDMVYLDDKRVRGMETPLERVQRAMWGMLHADNAGNVSRYPDGLVRMVTVSARVYSAFRLIVSEAMTAPFPTQISKDPTRKGEPPTYLPRY